MANFHEVFGYKNDTLAFRFYNLLADGFNGQRIFLPRFYAKLSSLCEAVPMQMNIFAFRLLDGNCDGLVDAKDLADITMNALKHCPEANCVAYDYPVLLDASEQPDMRPTTDASCKCALNQEMNQLFRLYHTLNCQKINYGLYKIKPEQFCRTVVLSVIAVEFRDKLCGTRGCPTLLGHCQQPTKSSEAQATLNYKEIKSFVNRMNKERQATVSQLTRELENPMAMRKRCEEAI